MEVLLAKNSGYCFGVRRAVEIAKGELGNYKIYSYGPLIHNPHVVEYFKERGMEVIDNIEDLKDIDDTKIVIRAHGVAREDFDLIESYGHTAVDTTCPYVKAVYSRVDEYYNKGYKVVIVGSSIHPEVIGINSWANYDSIIINTIEEAEKIRDYNKLLVVSQTTNTEALFKDIANILSNNNKEVKVFNTICKATYQRQSSAEDLSKDVDCMIVLGGYNSSNTNKLKEVSKRHCKNVFHVESVEELPFEYIKKFNKIGITAGASTPDWIIKEAIKRMSNIENNNMNSEMMEAIENSFTRINRGDVITGEVLFVTNTEVMVNINYKSDGIITKDELSNNPDVNPKEMYKPGDEIQVCVLRLDDGEGNVVLSSKRVQEAKGWEELEEIYNNKENIDVEVLKDVKGGLSVLVNGINGFMPASHVSVNYVSDLSSYKGEKFPVKIIDFDKERRRIILSRKEIEKVELEKKQEALWDKLVVNELIKGTVQRLTDFGAFVDLGGLDGLIHISDLSWNRIKNPSEVVKVGQEVEVLVLSLDKERNRISLGLKQTQEKPWDLFLKSVNEGDLVSGKVVNIMDFGAFVRLEQGIDGLLHVSQISNEHVNKPSDVLKVGQELEVRVIGINEADKKISLSTKEEVEEDLPSEEVKSEDADDVTIGDIIE